MKKECKICLNAMVGNEERVILRMLESSYQYIDYWVIQCNGSDKTQSIIEKFYKQKNIPGFVYNHEWDFPGVNRDHTLQTALKSEHKCDWILRMDADEQLKVDDDFDWSPLNEKKAQSFNMTALSPGSIYFRTWLWNSKYPWKFAHDRRHECIYLDDVGQNFERVHLDKGFRHVITNDGETWDDKNKFLTDALELEKQKVPTNKLLDDFYHFWYIGKSYYDSTNMGDYPLGEEHTKEYARRTIFYFNQYLNYKHNYQQTGRAFGIDEMAYFAMYAMGNMWKIIGDYEKSIDCGMRAEEFAPLRNEHIVLLAECFDALGDFESMKYQTDRLMDSNRKLPFPQYNFLLNMNCYNDTGKYCEFLHTRASGSL